MALLHDWPVQDIVYTAIVGVVMLMACFEWLLWLAAFAYCLFKVFQKSKNWYINILCLIVGVIFVLFRSIFLPIMVVMLPLHNKVASLWPQEMVVSFQWFGFWSFVVLLNIPWLLCIYQLFTNRLGRSKRIKRFLDDTTAPKVVVVMPCYKEKLEVLLAAINSVTDCDYPAACIHIFLSFDGMLEDDLYLKIIGNFGIPLNMHRYPSSIDIIYRGSRITVSRFPHGGKRHCQKLTFKLIDKVYEKYLKRNDDLFILLLDSDCVLDTVCLQNFVYDMELSPGNTKDMMAMTGIITSTTRKHSIITILQDIEYIHGQLFERMVESGCGSVTCLPGALTMLRFSAFRKVAKEYFTDNMETYDDMFDYAKCHLGEDRWLTHLLMIGAEKRYQIQICASAFCKTEAVQTHRSLIKQRRRWFLGFITNEACMLTDWQLWKRYPILILIRFLQITIQTTSLLFFILALSLITTAKTVKDLPAGFIAISLGLNWLLMLYFGAKLGRFKIWLYPLMFVLNPFYNWFYLVYGVLRARQQTWGGPRTDAEIATSTVKTREGAEQPGRWDEQLDATSESFKATREARRATSNPESASYYGRNIEGVCTENQPLKKTNVQIIAQKNTASRLCAHPAEPETMLGLGS